MMLWFGVMWGLWRSACNGLSSLNANLHLSQRNSHGRSARSRFDQVLLVLSSPSLSSNTPSICQALFSAFLYCVLLSVLHINLRRISAFDPWATSDISFEYDPFRALLRLVKDGWKCFHCLFKWRLCLSVRDKGFISQGLHLKGN